jgi:hypothetical protein
MTVSSTVCSIYETKNTVAIPLLATLSAQSTLVKYICTKYDNAHT